MKISRVSQMRAMDRAAIEEYGIPEALLMENAGQAVYAAIRAETGTEGKSFLVLCGPGNNGGDGLVVARKLHSAGAAVKVLALGEPAGLKGAAKVNYGIACRLGLAMAPVAAMQTVREDLARCDVVVDAMLGTGLTRQVEGLWREVVEAINSSGKTVVAVDIPSGVQGDTAQPMGAAVEAHCTVTFGLPKLGNVLAPGCFHGGRLYVSHISLPPALTRQDSLQAAINLPLSPPPRSADGHKGSFGQALFVAGAAAYYGAPRLAALSFLRAGGGYSRLAAPRSMVPFLAGKGSEIVFLPQDETPAGSLALASKTDLLELASRMDMVVVGPGLSLDAETQQLVRELAAGVEKPLLIDGDGLTAVAADLSCLSGRAAETLLTPHLGEMARLTGMTPGKVDADKVEALQRTAAELEATIVLKGARSLIGYPDGRVLVNVSGNSGMATAGAGDVLTGAIAAMHGLGLSVAEAVPQGVLVHGLAGDLAARDIGEDGMTAQDILDHLPAAVKLLRQGGDDNLGGWLVVPQVI